MFVQMYVSYRDIAARVEQPPCSRDSKCRTVGRRPSSAVPRHQMRMQGPVPAGLLYATRPRFHESHGVHVPLCFAGAWSGSLGAHTPRESAALRL